MKVQYVENDINSGMYLLRNGNPDITNLYKVCWTNKKEYCLVSMTDGWIDVYKSKADLVNQLNDDDNGYIPIDMITLIDMLRCKVRNELS